MYELSDLIWLIPAAALSGLAWFWATVYMAYFAAKNGIWFTVRAL